MKAWKKIASMLLALAMMAGCGSSGSSKSKYDAATTFRFGSEGDVVSMDSAYIDEGMSFNAIHLQQEGLTMNDENGKIVNGVAKSYAVSKDGKTYTFKLREDAKWDNGDPVTANDFVFAWKRAFKVTGLYYYMFGDDAAHIVGGAEAVAATDNGELTDEILDGLGVKAIDDKTLQVKLTTKTPYFYDLMSFPCFYPQNEKFVTECGEDYGKDAEHLLSNGAYKLTSWTKSKTMEFEKNENYFNADKVAMDHFVMELAMDPQSAASNFDTDELDFTIITSSIVDKYKDTDSYLSFSEGYLYYLELNMKNEDLQNLNIRKGLSLAIDREDICNNVLKDGSIPATGFVPTGLSYNGAKEFRKTSKATGKYTTFDLTAAQEAIDKGLKELGKDSVTLGLIYDTDYSPMDIYAEYLQGVWSKLKGVNIEVAGTTKQDRIYNREKNGDFDIACTRWGPDYPDATTYLTLRISGNAQNYGKYDSAAYDKLMKQVSKEEDMDKRFDKMIEAEEVLLADYDTIPVFEKAGCGLLQTSVKGLVTKSFGVPLTFTYVTKTAETK
ncbi:MAG: peptide ABC transporter substrate-binding protein [Erysipelotrichaceae bacterium]|nr:peptide ABC transporter substrate-binding protein [Erysipelotrichaceae bacterium]